MRFLKFAVIFSLYATISLRADDSAIYDFESLTTTSDRVYRGILVINADANGLMFRHESGIAKLPYHSLSQNLRMLYEPVAEVEAEPSGDKEVAVEEAKTSVRSDFPATIHLRSSTRASLFLDTPHAPYFFSPTAPRWFVPPRFSLHEYGRFLATPLGRELATRDFLLTTGLWRDHCYSWSEIR